jgi:hypothetical protein
MASKLGRQAFKEGDVFLVPLSDGSHSIGQVLRITKQALNSVLCAFFDIRSPENGQFNAALPEDALIAVQFVTPESLKRGSWKVVRSDEVPFDIERHIPLAELASNGFVGAKIRGSGIIDSFLNAYFCLTPWDDWHDPKYFDSLLAPGVKRPRNAILIKPRFPRDETRSSRGR